MAYKACVKQYYQDIEKVKPQPSAIPGIIDIGAKTLTFFFPFPFQIAALCFFDSLPQGETPNFNGGRIFLDTTANQNTYSQMLQALFIAMGFANAQMSGTSNGMTAYDSITFAEYMHNYLTPALQPGYFNTFIKPGNDFIDFWIAEAALADPNGTKQRFNQLLEFIGNNSFYKLYGAPGKYIINLDPLVNTEPYFTDLAAYLALGETPVINLYVLGINQFDLIPDMPGNPLTNTIDSINFDIGNPDAILWDA